MPKSAGKKEGNKGSEDESASMGMSEDDESVDLDSSGGSSVIHSDEDDNPPAKKSRVAAPSSGSKAKPSPAKKESSSSKKQSSAASNPSPASKASKPLISAKAKVASPAAAVPFAASASSSSSAAPAASSANVDITRGPPVTTDVSAKKLIASYLRQQNRPYSSIQVHDNLHKRVPKPTVERVLVSLSQSGAGGGIICKEYGKAKIFFVDQSTMPSKVSPAQIDALCKENDQSKKSNEASRGEEIRLKSALQQCLAEPVDDELERLEEEAQASLAQKRERLQLLSKGPSSSSSSSGGGSKSSASKFTSLSHAVQAHNYYRKTWLTRKQLCMDAVDILSEGLGKKTKDVMSEMCLETDQDAGVALPPSMMEPK
ncbi:Tat binding protein 1-interacting protein-domain-containing protein [Ochromonadaceae sp. CCMP2298]|nr:Tat binding protein 1-interacting protein-domain-containing protein [Ochromonadaceae sp. CCMP2298]